MTRSAAALIMVVLLASGCSQSDVRPEPAPTRSADLTIGYGRVGPVRVGMTETEALKTGLLRSNAPSPVDGCPTPPLEWRKPFKDDVDVITYQGRIVTLGVTGRGPRTSNGIRVGSSLRDVQKAFPRLLGPAAAGYDQAGGWVHAGDRWIGFLFGAATATKVNASDKVTFIEVTRGKRKPDLIRDGC
jgi:hypothetical protein